MVIVGPPGCGKSTVLEALELIYKCGAKPERSNSFPLSSSIDQEVLLWQEFKWSRTRLPKKNLTLPG